MIGATFELRGDRTTIAFKVERVEEGVVYFKTLLEGGINVDGAFRVETLEKLIGEQNVEKNLHPKKPPNPR